MKRRTVIFGLVWAYVFNTLWVPGGLDGGYLLSVFFPAWHLFLLGLIIGGVHETLAPRWSRIGVSVVMTATLSYLCVAMFGGHTEGFYLAVPMAAATALASLTAACSRLTGHRLVPNWGRFLLGISAAALLVNAACLPNQQASRKGEAASPDGVYLARRYRWWNIAPHSQEIVVGPRYAPVPWFGSSSVHGAIINWTDNGTLYISRSKHNQPLGRYLDVRIEDAPTL